MTYNTIFGLGNVKLIFRFRSEVTRNLGTRSFARFAPWIASDQQLHLSNHTSSVTHFGTRTLSTKTQWYRIYALDAVLTPPIIDRVAQKVVDGTTLVRIRVIPDAMRPHSEMI